MKLKFGEEELWLGSEMTTLTETTRRMYGSGTSFLLVGGSDRDAEEGGWLVAGKERHQSTLLHPAP